MASPIQQLLTPEVKDLGGFQARRSLPHSDRTLVGPFIFFDHLGPATFPPGKGVDVRPHPHINLATVTYLFDGALMHRDSLGTVQEIKPGAVNWMTAGRGIVHSERSPQATRDQTTTLHAIQTWIALPKEHEETEPTFHHYPANELPQWNKDGARIKLIAGKACGYQSPVTTFSPMLYLDVQLQPGSQFTIPADYSERAVYSVTNDLSLGSSSLGSSNLDRATLEQHRLALVTEGATPAIYASSEARCIVIGGEPIGGRIKWWNFVSSRSERIEQAKQDWANRNFEPVPDEDEFIPLPADG